MINFIKHLEAYQIEGTKEYQITFSGFVSVGDLNHKY